MTLDVAYTLEQCWHRVPGGTASSAIGTARALAARDDVRLVGIAARHRDTPPDPWTPPIPVRHLALPRRVLYEAWHSARRPRIEKASGPVDVIHATGMAIPPRSAPLVVTVHDLGFVHYPGHATRNGQRFFRRSLELTQRDADLVLVPSEVTRQDCIANGIDAQRVRVVPWGIDPELLTPVGDDDADPARADDAATRLARHGLRAGGYVLWVGTIEPRKNLGALVDAFSRLTRPDLQLALVGPTGWNEDVRGRLAPFGDRARALGFVSGDDLRVLYKHAVAFCYPSIFEGFGMPVLEAMAAGAAVVTSRGTATEEVLGGCGLAVDPHDPEAIADALAALVDDPELRARLGSAARSRAAGFTWERTADLTAQAYAAVHS